MRLNGVGHSDDVARSEHQLMIDVCRSVLSQMRVGGDAAERLVNQVMAARLAAPNGDVTLRFSARDGELEIVLTSAAGDWRTSCPVPMR